MSAMFRVILT